MVGVNPHEGEGGAVGVAPPCSARARPAKGTRRGTSRLLWRGSAERGVAGRRGEAGGWARRGAGLVGCGLASQIGAVAPNTPRPLQRA